MGTFIKKHAKKRAIKLPVAVLVCALLVVGGGIAYKAMANPDVAITPAIGGEAVSIDTTSDGGIGTWTDLNNPAIAEGVIGDIGLGTHTMTLPDGWKFNTSQTVNIGVTSGGASGLVLGANIIAPTETTLTFYVSAISTNGTETLTFDGLEVMPTNQSVGTGNITMTVGTIEGVTNGTTNFGTLTTVAGVITQVAFTTQPSNTVYGSNINPSPVVKTQDQFGNDSIVGLPSSKDITLTLAGTGLLTGTKIIDIGTGAGNGTVTFIDLAVDTVGNGNQLSASATGLMGNDSSLFNISSKLINVTAQTDTKVYDGSDGSSVAPVVDPLAAGDTIATAPTQAFDNKNVGTGKTLTASGLLITGGNSNYTINYVNDTTGEITKKGLTVTGATVTSKTYDGNTDAVVSGAILSGVESGDVVALGDDTVGTFDNKNVGTGKTVTTAMTITGDDAGNYILTQPTLTGDVTKRDITITATANEKVYDDNIIAIALPTITDGTLAIGDNGVYAETYDDQNVGDTKTLAPTVTSIVDGSSADMTGNYDVTLATADVGKITTKAVNVTAQTDTKEYDGDVDSSVSPIGDSLEGNDTYVSEGTQTFDDKDVDTGKTLTPAGASITEAGNYTINYVNDTTGEITKKGLTVTGATVTSKTYDGNTDAVVSGAILSGVESGDVVALGDDTVGTFDNKNVGTGKTVTTAMTITGDDAGNYILTQPTLTGDVTKRDITITATANEKVYDDNIIAIALPTITDGTLAIGDNGVYAETYDDQNVGDTKTLAPTVTSIVDGSSADMTGNYDVTLATADVGKITTKAVNVTAQTDTKEYDGDVDSSVSPIGDSLEGNDTYVSEGTQTFDDKDVDTGKTLTPAGASITEAGNYTINYVNDTTGEITKKGLTVTGATVTSKTYDGNTDAVVSGATLDGVISPDIVTLVNDTSGTFDNKNVGTGKTVTTAMTITGDDAGNYILTQPTLTGAITERNITVTPATNTKVYDKTTAVAAEPTITSGTLVTGDVAVFSATYDNVNFGSAKTLTPAVTSIVDGSSADMTGNYNVILATADVGEITAQAVNVTAQIDTKIYDGNVNSSVSPIGDSLESGDTWTSEGAQVFSQSDVGDNLTLTASGASINDGNGGANYTISYITNGTGEITKKGLTVTGATVTSKTYDGNTDAVVSGATLDGVISPDIVTLVNDTSGTFDNKNVGTGKTVTTAMTITGDDAGNYILTQPTLTAGEIIAKPINVTAQTDTKTYNGTANSAVAPVVDPLAAGDTIATAPTQAFDNKNVGTGKTLTASGLLITGGNSNYAITYVDDTTGVITVKLINVTAQTDTKVYNGTANSSVAPVVDPLAAGDTIATAPTQAFDNKNVGTGKTLTASGLLITGGNSNYAITYVDDTTGVITAKDITVTADAGQTKTYNETDPIFTYTHDALVGSDSISGALGRVAGGDVGTYAFSIGTLDAGTNYNLSVAATPTFSITQLSITGNFTADNKTYDGNTDAVVLTRTLNGVIGGDNVALTGGTASFANANVADGITVTASGMTLSGTAAGNYSLASVADMTANITAIALTITADSKIKEFGDDDPTLTYQLTSGALIDSSITGLLTRDAGEAVGVYTINKGTVTAGSNYDITYVSGILTIQDTTAPVITDETPTGTTSDTTPVINANYFDAGSDINVATAIIKIDGTQIPEGFYTKTGEGISYALLNPLFYDFHTVYVEVEDMLSNKAIAEWTFQIAEIDEVAPTATQYPSNDSTDVAVDIYPYIDFSEAMNGASLNNNVKLKTYIGSSIVAASYSITTNGNGTTRVTITPTPDSDLTNNTQYYFWIDNDVEDLAGNNIAEGSWYAGEKDNHEFTTIAEDVPVISYDISLNAGWNLISLPLIPTDSDIGTVLAGISDNVEIVWYYEDGDWFNNIDNSLTTMEDGKGYWIFMEGGEGDTYILTINGSETIEGGGSPLSYQLAEDDWNLIGFKSTAEMIAGDYVRDFTNKTLNENSILWNYKNGSYPSAPLHSSDDMEPGYGYWLLLK